jgi:hypothetical protein
MSKDGRGPDANPWRADPERWPVTNIRCRLCFEFLWEDEIDEFENIDKQTCSHCNWKWNDVFSDS